MTTSTIDLEALRRTEPARVEPGAFTRKRLAWALLLVGAGLAVVFVALPWLRPRRHVMTSAVRVDANAASRAASVAEATGWIEPSPFPTIVRPLVDGIVESIAVLEGQAVKAGDVVARLRNVEKEFELERAKAALANRVAQVAAAQAALDEAEALLEQRLDLRAEVTRLAGDADLAERETAVARAEASAAAGRLAAASAELDAQVLLERRGSGTPVLLEKARGDVASAKAEQAAKDAAVARWETAGQVARAQAEIAREGLSAPRALEGAVKRARAGVEVAKAEAELERTNVALAERDVSLLTLRAPVEGVVLRRESSPGSVVGPGVMPAPGAGGEMSANSGVGGVVSLYDPASLQARLLVPVEAAAAAGVGREVEVTADTLPDRVFRGTVVRVQSEVDIRLPRVEAEVVIADPDPLLKPGVVARGRFLAPAPKAGEAAPAPRVLVPRRALHGDAVFVIDPRGGGRARRVPVTKVADEGDWVEVRGDVSATHRVILDEVREGDPVTGDAS